LRALVAVGWLQVAGWPAERTKPQNQCTVLVISTTSNNVRYEH
jgi:hypothetical protein